MPMTPSTRETTPPAFHARAAIGLRGLMEGSSMTYAAPPARECAGLSKAQKAC